MVELDAKSAGVTGLALRRRPIGVVGAAVAAAVVGLGSGSGSGSGVVGRAGSERELLARAASALIFASDSQRKKLHPEFLPFEQVKTISAG
jgi:hypothetical protein